MVAAGAAGVEVVWRRSAVSELRGGGCGESGEFSHRDQVGTGRGEAEVTIEEVVEEMVVRVSEVLEVARGCREGVETAIACWRTESELS